MLLAYSLEICHGLFKNLQNILLQFIVRTVRTTLMQSSECVISVHEPCRRNDFHNFITTSWCDLVWATRAAGPGERVPLEYLP